MTKAIICEHGLSMSKCRPCRNAREQSRRRAVRSAKLGYKPLNMPRLVLCDHDLPISKCRPCRNIREASKKREKWATDELYRESQLRKGKAYARTNTSSANASRKHRYHTDEAFRNSKLAREAVWRVLNPASGVGGKPKPRAYNPIHHWFTFASRYATKNSIPYSKFFRCKDCKRSTPNVNRYCDEHQDVYQVLQAAIELYQLIKLSKKRIHHERYQECNHE